MRAGLRAGPATVVRGILRLAAGLLAAAGILLAAGCSSKFQGFAFETPEGARIDIWQSARVSPDQETKFTPGPGRLSSPEYRLASPVTIASSGEAFAFSYKSDFGPSTVSLFSDKNKLLTSFALPATGGTSLRYEVPLEQGSRIWGYQLTAKAGSAPGTLTLEGAGILAFVHGFLADAERLTVDGSIEVLSASSTSTTARLTEATRSEMANGIWLLRFALGEGAAGGRVELSDGEGRSASFELDPASTPGWLDFARGSVPFLPRDVSFAGTLRSLQVLRVPVESPIPADPGQVLTWDQSSWRKPDFELFSWSRYPRVLILDMASYEIQDAFFKRLAFFVEKAGHAGKLESLSALKGLHGYNAHDYRAEDLARFFDAATKDPGGLSAEEGALATLLVDNGVVKKTADGYAPGDGCILSISRSSSPLLRALLLTHESFHGLFFTLPAFRDATEAAWAALTEDERAVWMDYLGSHSYDTTDHYLVVNEFQSYLMQQERTGVWGFQNATMARMRAGTPREAALARRIAVTHPATFLKAFDVLDGALQSAGGPPGGQSLAVRKVER